MTKIAKPRTTEAATRLLERYATLAGVVALAETNRSAELARINAVVDLEVQPMLEEQANITAALEPWWAANGNTVAPGTRKSVQLGGCMIGSRQSRAKLGHGFDNDKLAVAALQTTRFAKHTLKVGYSLDRTATLKLLQVGGKTAAAIAELGFREEPGEETFFIEPVEQAGVVGS